MRLNWFWIVQILWYGLFTDQCAQKPYLKQKDPVEVTNINAQGFQKGPGRNTSNFQITRQRALTHVDLHLASIFVRSWYGFRVCVACCHDYWH